MNFYVNIGKIKLLNPSFFRGQIWWYYQFWCLDFKFCSFQVQKWPGFSKYCNKFLDFSKKLILENLTTSIWQVFFSHNIFFIYIKIHENPLFCMSVCTNMSVQFFHPLPVVRFQIWAHFWNPCTMAVLIRLFSDH